MSVGILGREAVSRAPSVERRVSAAPVSSAPQLITNYCKKLNSLKHLVRTTVAESHNSNSKYEKGAIT